MISTIRLYPSQETHKDINQQPIDLTPDSYVLVLLLIITVIRRPLPRILSKLGCMAERCGRIKVPLACRGPMTRAT